MRAQALVSIVGFGGLGEKVSRFLSKAPSKLRTSFFLTM